MTGKRIVVIGEALIDILPDGREAPGGSPANTALALSRLGKNVTFVTTLADDAHGATLRKWLTDAGVTVIAAEPGSGRTSTAAVKLDDAGAATYDFDLSWDISAAAIATALAPDQGEVGLVHVGSIATVLDPGAAVVEDALWKLRFDALPEGVRRPIVSFDPNARPAITPDPKAIRPRVERLVAVADVVKASQEDIQWLYPDREHFEVAAMWRDASKLGVPGGGPEFVVVTLGGAGSDGFAAVPVGPSDRTQGVIGLRIEGAPKVADTIGAGDTFMGALLDSIWDQSQGERSNLQGVDLGEAMAWATRAAAINVTRVGCNPPTRAELEADGV